MSYLKTIDQGVLAFLRAGLDLDAIVYSHSDTALRKRATDLASGRSVLPFVSYFSSLIEKDVTRLNQMAWYRGRAIVWKDFNHVEKTDILMRKTIPVKIHYQIDLWANSREDLNERIAKFIWAAQTHVITVDMSEFATGQRYHFFVDNQTDNTNLAQEFEQGRIYRYTYDCHVDGEIMEEDWIKTVLTDTITTEILKESDDFPTNDDEAAEGDTVPDDDD